MYKRLRPLLFALPPELAHRVGMKALRFFPEGKPGDPGLARIVCGIPFPNPVGLAAGFDKYAEALPYWQRLGFGFAEIGTFTRLPQPGNAPPRVWRYPGQGALINRFGFNNPGADLAARRMARLRASGRWPRIPIGISLGKSKAAPADAAIEDYLYSLERLQPFADYLAINVSSPNTPGLRDLQASRTLKQITAALVKACRQPTKRPLLVKLAPDLGERELLASADAALSAGASGLILTNTSIGRDGLPAGQYPEGGLSGAPIRPKADRALSLLARHTRGRVPLIGSGGVMTVQDAVRKLELGASLVQIYTGFIYQGPDFPRQICQELVDKS